MNINCRWPSLVSSSIQEQLSEENLTGADAWDEIQNICRKTVEDLKKILSKLEDFQTNELQVDQKKRKHIFFLIKIIIHFPVYMHMKEITPFEILISATLRSSNNNGQ